MWRESEKRLVIFLVAPDELTRKTLKDYYQRRTSRWPGKSKRDDPRANDSFWNFSDIDEALRKTGKKPDIIISTVDISDNQRAQFNEALGGVSRTLTSWVIQSKYLSAT
jgi:hypothetical protein